MASLHAWIAVVGAVMLAAYGFATGPFEVRAAGTLGFAAAMLVLTMLQYERASDRDDHRDDEE